jgi:hypothetical protein
VSQPEALSSTRPNGYSSVIPRTQLEIPILELRDRHATGEDQRIVMPLTTQGSIS